MHEVAHLPQHAEEPQPDGPLAESLLDGLLAGVLPEPPGPLDAVARAVQAHRDHRRSWYGDLIGPLGVPAACAVQLVDALRPTDHALPMVLLGPWSPQETALRTGVRVAQQDLDELMRAARAQLLDDDRIALTGVELGLAQAPSPALAAELTLAELDVAAPGWLRVPADARWVDALDVIAADGAEHVALVLPNRAEDGADGNQHLATLIVAVVARGLRFCLVDPPGGLGIDLVTSGSAYGLLNLLCAVHEAVDGAEPAQVAAVLAQARPEELTRAARALSPGNAAGVRRLLDRVACASVRALVTDLEATGLIAPDVA
jgi:hypothetical protein